MLREILSQNPKRRATTEAAARGALIKGLQTPQLHKQQFFGLGRNSYACKKLFY
jgi:hypothetical protein